MEAKDNTSEQRQQRRAEAKLHNLDAAMANCDINDIPQNTVAATVSFGMRVVVGGIIEMRQAWLPGVVAPYEAESQLAWLAKPRDIVKGVTTVDGDVVVHDEAVSHVYLINFELSNCGCVAVS
eukprot:jgi/Tetstr1/460086/TSEL_005406.t1